MKEKSLRDDVSWGDLTDTQTEIAETAIENPEITQAKIAEKVGCSSSYVSSVHQNHLSVRIIPEEVGTEDIDEDIYEVIVAGVESMEEVDQVERHYDLNLNRGGSKEVDVAVWISKGGHEFLVTIECKFHDKKVGQDVPASMAWYQENSTANKTIIISRNGFQSGARSLSEDAEIDLYQFDKLDRSVGQDHLMKIDTEIKIQSHTVEVTGLELEPVGGESHEGDVSGLVNDNPQLYDENRRPTGEHIFNKAREASLSESPGIHTEELDNRFMLLDDIFYEIRAIEYEVHEAEEIERDFEIDAYEEYDLYMRDELADGDTDIDLVSIEGAVRAFEEEVR